MREPRTAHPNHEQENEMGFNLKLYFEELDELLSDGSKTEAEKLAAIAKHMEESRQYARECGMVR
jgi:hypothetical protein